MSTGAGAFLKGVGYALTAMVAVCLIIAWILTSPLFRWGVFLSDCYRKRFR